MMYDHARRVAAEDNRNTAHACFPHFPWEMGQDPLPSLLSPNVTQYLEVSSVQSSGQMLAHFGQLGSGAPGTGSLTQGLLLQVLLQFRLP